MQPAEKKYNLAKNGKRLFWFYLVQSFLFCVCLVYANYTGTPIWSYGIGKVPPLEIWLCYVLLILIVAILTTSVVGIVQYYKKKTEWVVWAISMGIVLTLLFAIMEVMYIVHGLKFSSFDLRYNLFMIDINLAFLAFLIKYNANARVAHEKLLKGEPLILEHTVDPKIAKVLFSIAAYSLCIEIGFACAIVVPRKVMSIIGAVLIGLIAFIILYFIFGNANDLEEYIE